MFFITALYFGLKVEEHAQLFARPELRKFSSDLSLYLLAIAAIEELLVTILLIVLIYHFAI